MTISVSRPAPRVAQLTIDRDEKRNALNTEVCTLLERALNDSLIDARAILITGAGSAFCSGADLSGGDVGEFYPPMESLFMSIRRAPVPVIAYVNGPAIGAGAMLAAVCDLRVVSPTARFMVPVADMAIGVNDVLVKSFELQMGGSWARAMLLAGASMSAADAEATGFAVRPSMFPRLELPGVGSEAHDSAEFAVALAELCAGKAPLTLRNVKMEFAHASGEPFSEDELESARQAPWDSADIREAAQAVAEKRTPEFRGE
ncbi:MULTISPECIES: enoyl-CoA hydratase-related protein [unclassified Corynebacterium]|uniref:enoyl-CoA hydratase-related protein n=1 Tax=unclassified Corynebacterium TaxID=2624378 RepID=UPI00210D37FA